MRCLTAVLPLVSLASCTREALLISPDPSPPAPLPSPPALPAATPEFVEEKPAKTPSAMPSVTAQAPKKDEVIPVEKSAEFEIRFTLRNWTIKEGGNGVHCILDNWRVRAIHDPKRKLRLGDFTGGKPLEEGFHLLAILPVHPGGESVKPTKFKMPAAILPFYVGKKTEPTWNSKEPLLLLNAPVSGKIPSAGVLFDFYLVNTELARGKVVVHASISGPDLARGESMSQWRPWRIKNAQPGEYLTKVELYHYVPDSFESGSAVSVNLVSKPMPGKWTSVTREFLLE
ncbi:MAG: hypothetical protein RMJ98_05195 [Myxococcales bacterium]|nr:hypothetical protein [Polyangiaceae bacterium]MDW8248685.1 hypothetical protein [Myxococcales bacterium]